MVETRSSPVGNLDDLDGLPMPLDCRQWQSDQERPPAPPGGERAWLLLFGETGILPLRLCGEAVALGAEEALLLPAASPGLAVEESPTGEAWSAVAFTFAGLDELVYSIRQSGQVLRLPRSCWARRQLSGLRRASLEELGLASAMRLVAGVIANLIEHNFEEPGPGGESALVGDLVNRLDRVVEVPDAQLGVIAEEAGISLSHMGRLFRRYLATTPSKYLHDRRMRRACTLLRQLDLEITAIASRLGYASASAFGAAFRSATGQSPSAYRASRSVPIWEQGS